MSKSTPKLALLLLVLGAFPACGKSGSQGSRPGKDGEEATDGSAAGENGGGGSSGESSRGPAIALTEKRLQAYIAYRKEFQGVWKGFMEEWQKLAKTVDEKSNQLTKAASALHGLTRISEKQDTILKALRKKHGFDEETDNRLWDAIGEVVAAKPIENPALEPSLKMFREMQAKGGEDKKAADEFFANLESTQKEGLEKAKEQYGAECVDILLKHVKELNELQMESLQKMMEAPSPGQ
jgi:prophage DNA circulation protein